MPLACTNSCVFCRQAALVQVWANDSGVFRRQAALVQVRTDLEEAEAARRVAEKEMRDQLLQLHAVQLQLHKQTAGVAADSDNIIKKLVRRRSERSSAFSRHGRLRAYGLTWMLILLLLMFIVRTRTFLDSTLASSVRVYVPQDSDRYL